MIQLPDPQLKVHFSPCSYIVATIYALGFIYSLPRFFEYKTEVQRENLTNFENVTEFYDYLVVKNNLQESQAYQYTVHLGRSNSARFNDLLLLFFISVLYNLFHSILPLLMLSYFNVE